MTLTSHSRSESPQGPLPAHLVHELKTALSMIMGFAELLETREDPETRSEATQGIVLAASRLQATIDSMTEEPYEGTSLDGYERDDASKTEARRRLMVIDDDPSELEVLRTAFARDSFELVEARDADRGFAVLDDVRPDLVILDWTLPGGGGAATLAELKLRNPDLPVIVISDDGDPKQRQIATLLDADEFVTRPFNAVDLVAKADLISR